MASDSDWVNVRHGVLGGLPGLGYDYFTGQGLWEEPAPYQVNWDTMPQYPGYQNAYDPQTMSLDGINPDPRALDALRSEALRPGPSKWAGLAEDKSRVDESRSRMGLYADKAAGAATARSNLAMRGGLTGGAAERVESSSNRDYMMGSQRLAGEAGANRMQIGINDERNRVAQLGMLPGLEQQNAQFQLNKKNTDIQRQLDEANRRNQYNMGLYNNQSQMWGAGQQANATASSGGGGSWLCTAALKNGAVTTKRWHEDEEKALLKFNRYARKRHSGGMKFYLTQCHELIRRMEAAGDVDWKAQLRFVRLVIFQVQHGGMEKAFVSYVKHVKGLIDKYWPECDNQVYTTLKGKAA